MVNTAGANIIGKPIEEIIGKDDTQLFPHHIARNLMEEDQKIIDSGNEVTFYEKIPKDGNIRFFHTLKVPYRSHTGNIIGVIGVARDVTERKREVEELEKTRKNLADAQRIAHLGSWESDIVKNRTIWSDEVYRQFGLIPQEFDGKNESFLNFVHPDDKESVKKAIKEALYKRRPYNVDFRIVLKDSTERILHSEAEVVFDDNGKPIRMIGTSLDVTERKQVEKAIQTLIKSIVGKTGQEFFDKVVVSMNEWLGTHCAFIGQITNGNNVKALSMQMDGKIIHDYGYTIGDGPCEVVVKDGYQVYKEKICELFPKNKVLSNNPQNDRSLTIGHINPLHIAGGITGELRPGLVTGQSHSHLDGVLPAFIV